MNFAFTLNDANGLTRDIPGEPGVCYLDIENQETSTGVLYLGDEPPGSVVYPADSPIVLNDTLTYFDIPDANWKNGVEVGMTVSGHVEIPGGTQVLRIENLPAVRRVHLSKALTGTISTSSPTFAAPAISATTGLSLQPGQRREFTAERGNAFLDRAFRLLGVTGAQCDVVVRRGKR